MIKTLFEHNANPNICDRITDMPAFFCIKTPEVAELFTNHKKFNIHASTRLCPNILWKKLEKPELVSFYLDRNINIRTLYSNNQSLLHRAVCAFYDLSIIELFITKIPDLINSLDNKSRTPLDMAMSNYYSHKDKLIALFRKYGAKTFEELAKEQA